MNAEHAWWQARSCEGLPRIHAANLLTKSERERERENGGRGRERERGGGEKRREERGEGGIRGEREGGGAIRWCKRQATGAASRTGVAGWAHDPDAGPGPAHQK
jgi:hypothetical protein